MEGHPHAGGRGDNVRLVLPSLPRAIPVHGLRWGDLQLVTHPLRPVVVLCKQCLQSYRVCGFQHKLQAGVHQHIAMQVNQPRS